MTERGFEILVNDQLDKIKQTLLIKGKEYAREDVLSNFKRGAKLLRNESPEKCLLGYWKKHLVSIINMIEDLDLRADSISLNKWDEKLVDSHNYQLLLRALIQERHEAEFGVEHDENKKLKV